MGPTPGTAQKVDCSEALEPGRIDRAALQKEAAPPLSATDELANGLSTKADPEVEKKIKALGAEISLLKGLGYRVVVREGITTGEDKLHVSGNLDLDRLVAAKEGQMERFSLFGAIDPWQIFGYHNGFCRDIAPVLSEKNGLAEVVPFCLEAKRTSGDEGVVRIYDYLCGQSRPVYERKVKLEGEGPLEAFYSVSAGDLERLRQEIPAVLSEKLRRHQAFLDKITPSPPAPGQCLAVSFVEDKILSAGELKAAGDLLADSASGLIIEGLPKGQAEDRVFKIDNFAKALSATLTNAALQGPEPRPVLFRGDVTQLAFTQLFKPESIDTEAQTINGRRVDKISRDSDGWLNTSLQYVDQYGNRIIENIRVPPGLEMGRRLVLIDVPTRFAPENEAGGKLEPVDFDLRPLGLSEVKNLLYAEPESVIARAGKYDISTNMAPDAVRRDFGPQFQDLQAGCEAAEKLLGFEAGELVKNIRIVESEKANASYQHRNKGSVVIRDELFRAGEDSAERVAFHETAHLIDGAADFKLSAGKMEELWKDLKKNHPNFLAALNEREFLPGMKYGGHTEDGPAELFASLLNSLNHPRWGDKVESSSTSLEFAECYRRSLDALEKSLRSSGNIRENAPIYDRLLQMRDVLDRTILERQAKRDIWQALEAGVGANER